MQQMDLFAAPPPVAPPRAKGEPERLLWGKGGGHWNEPGLTIELRQDDDGWRYRRQLSMPNLGSSGPYCQQPFADRDAALVDALRRELDTVAHHLAVYGDGAWSENHGKPEVWRKLATWCIQQAPPPMFGGPDLALEYTAELERATAKEQRRRAALMAAHDLEKRAQDVIKDCGFYGYPDLIHNPERKDWPGAGEDAEGHARAWPATWGVEGVSPHALKVVIRTRAGRHNDAVVRRTLDALREALPEPVELEPDGDSPKSYYRSSAWTWDETGSSG